MTSGNSSLGRFINEQRAMLWRRLPLLALSMIAYFIYDVFGTFLILQMQRADIYSDILFELRGAAAVSGLMGIAGIGWMIGGIGAVILAVQGFSFLYRSQTVDFYESRPEKRSTRFFNIVLNGFLIYLIPSLFGMIFSFLIAAANGCAPTWLLIEMLISWVLQTILFLAYYGMSILASLLTGTLVTALLMNLYFFGIETVIRLTIIGYRAAYYATFDLDKADGLLSSIITQPGFNYIIGQYNSIVASYIDSNIGVSTDLILSSAGHCVKGAVINLVLFAVSMILSFIVYQKRRSESAGQAVIFRPLEIFIKFTSGVVFALDAGLFIYWIFDEERGASTLPVILTMLIVVFVNSIILESVFALNVRMAFKKAWHMPIIAVAAIAILFIYKSGITGYDSYLPKAQDVSSSYIVNCSYNSDYYDETDSYMPATTYVEKSMFLTCTDDVLKLAAIGEDEAVRLKKENDSDNGYFNYWDVTLGWRLNNGRIVTRQLIIPEDIDAALMDRIIGNEEFINGAYHISDVIPYIEKTADSKVKRVFTFNVNTEHGSLETKKDMTKGFLDAYKKDVYEKYDFTMASNNNPVGYANLYDNRSYNMTWPIYESYENTIAYLESEEMWNGGFLEPDEIEKIIIIKGSFDEETGEHISDNMDVTDRSEIEEIFDSSISGSYYSAWQKSGSLDNEKTIEVHPLPETQVDDSYNAMYYRSFYKDRIPGFIGD